QTYGDDVTIGAITTLTSNSGGNIAFAKTLNGAFDLTANTSGTTSFAGIVGGNAPLATITTDAAGTTAINTTAIPTTGTQTYNDAVALGANAVVNAGTAAVTFGQTVDGNFSLAVNTTGATNFLGAVGGGANETQNLALTGSAGAIFTPAYNSVKSTQPLT